MDWIENEYGSMNIGDERLNKRAKQLLKRCSDKPMESIPASCKGWSETKAAYRFFENDLVTAKSGRKSYRMNLTYEYTSVQFRGCTANYSMVFMSLADRNLFQDFKKWMQY